MKKLLFVHNLPTAFVKIDLDILKEIFKVEELYIKSKSKLRIFDTLKFVRQSDIVFGWFASWHLVPVLLFAKIFSKPMVVVTGGYDTANLKDIGYGNQRKWLSRNITNWILKKADLLICNSNFTKNETSAISSELKRKIKVIYHGIPDKTFDLTQKGKIALNVGNVSRENLERKGILKFVKTAKLLPDYHFIQAGRWLDDSIVVLKSEISSNVDLMGFVSDETLSGLYGKSKIYLQPSLHEGFGMSVAEAMLAGCIPVVTPIGALPEVTGKFAVFINSRTEEGIRDAINTTDDYPYSAFEIREHIRQNFTIDKRRELLKESLTNVMESHYGVS